MQYYYPIKDLNTLTKLLEVVPQESFCAIFVGETAYLGSKVPFKDVPKADPMPLSDQMKIYKNQYQKIPFSILVDEFVNTHSRMVRDMAVKSVRAINQQIIKKIFEDDQVGFQKFADRYNEILESDDFYKKSVDPQNIDTDVNIDELIKEVFGGND